jgi:NhaP-type Na+/H+ or K+/H+ antiporter
MRSCTVPGGGVVCSSLALVHILAPAAHPDGLVSLSLSLFCSRRLWWWSMLHATPKSSQRVLAPTNVAPRGFVPWGSGLLQKRC